MTEINNNSENIFQINDEDEMYPVDKIVGRRIRKGKVEYRVRWKNYPPDTDSWEPSKSLNKTCHSLIKEFNNENKFLNNNFNIQTSTDSSNEAIVLSNKNHEKLYQNNLNSSDKTLKSSLNHIKSKQTFEMNSSKQRLKENLSTINYLDKSYNEKSIDKCQLELSDTNNKNSELTDNAKNSIKDSQKSDKNVESMKDYQKKVIYLEDNEIDEPVVSKSKHPSINGLTDKFVKNSIDFLSVLSDRVSSTVNKNSEDLIVKLSGENSNSLKRKTLSFVGGNHKKQKLNDKESKINPISFIEKDQIQKFHMLSLFNNNNIIFTNNNSDNNNNSVSTNYSHNNNNNVNNHKLFNTNNHCSNKSPLDSDTNHVKCKNFKSPIMLKPRLISEEKIEKSFGKLPFQRYKESDHFDNNEMTEIRRTSIRQIEATNRFREIIVRKNVAAGFTEICLHNNSHSFPNCFNIKILNELNIAFKQAVNDSSRVILLSAIGNVFSSGIDLETIISSAQKCVSNVKNVISTTAQLTTPLHPTQQIHDLVESLRKFLLELLHFPKPIVVGINGPAVGLGCAILPLCDLIYATESSSFYLPYTSLSQTPEAGSSLTLPMLVGMSNANQLLLCGRKWSAKEAYNKGLISEIIFSDKFKAELFSRCEKLAHVPSMCTETMKCMLRIHCKEQIDVTINMECRKLIEIWKSNEFKNSAQSFIDNELPNILL